MTTREQKTKTTILQNGRLIDPVRDMDVIDDLWIEDGVVSDPLFTG